MENGRSTETMWKIPLGSVERRCEMKYSCCIEMLFTEYAFADRIYKAQEAGFDYVEFWCWDNKDLDAVRRALQETGMEIALMQGNRKGRMVDKADRNIYVEGVRESVEIARELGVKRLFLMSDILRADRTVAAAPYPITEEEKVQASIMVLKDLIPISEEADITFLIEPLNTKVDHKGYSLCRSDLGMKIIQNVSHPGIRLLYDAYHMQIMEGNIIDTIRKGSDTFRYFHIADVPGRNQPGTGELNYINIIKVLSESGYDGPVGFEFGNKDDTSMAICTRLLAQLKEQEKTIWT